LSVRLDPGHLRKFRRLATRLKEDDAAALLRKLVVAVVSGDAQRREILSDIYARLDALDVHQAMLPLAREGRQAGPEPPERAGKGVRV
jgi:hypothetical protein